jgi:programmed cell death protein 5
MSESKDSEPVSSAPDRQSSRAERDRQERAAKEQMLRVIFTTEARERLGNIRIVRPDLADAIQNQLFQYAATGKLRKQVTDEELKQMLESFQRPKREFKINFK